MYDVLYICMYDVLYICMYVCTYICVWQDTGIPGGIPESYWSHDHFLSMLFADFCRQPSTCFHPMSHGQELCYICHQRAMANIPVSFTEERRQREKLEDQVLQEYLQKKESLEMAKDQVRS